MAVAKLLLSQEAKLDAADQFRTTPFLLAAREGKLEMAKFLLEKGAELRTIGNDGFTALHEAADRGHVGIVEFLIQCGLSVDSRENHDATPLLLCSQAEFVSQERYAAVARALLARGADVHAVTRQGQTALHRAAFSGHPQVMEVLLAAGAKLSARDDEGKTALDLAADSEAPRLRREVATGRRECAKLLRKTASEPKAATGGEETTP